MKKLSFIILLCTSIILFSNTIFAENETKILVIGQFLNQAVYPSNTGDDDFLLPLVETSRILGANVHYGDNQNEVSIIIMNFPQAAETYETKYILGSTQYNFIANSNEVKSIHTGTGVYYEPEHIPVIINGIMYLSSKDIAKMFHLDIYYNPETNIYHIGSYAIPASGEYEGFQLLKGHPLENLYNLYFKIEGNVSDIKCENLALPNMYEMVTFTYQGKVYTTTRFEAYKLLDKINVLTSELSGMGAYNAAKEIDNDMEAMFGSTAEEWYEEWGKEIYLERYFSSYKSWLQRQQRNEVIAPYMSDEQFEQRKQEKIKQENKKIMEEDLKNYITKIEIEWQTMQGYEFQEWVTINDLYKKYGLSISPSLDKNYYWDLFINGKKQTEIPFPSKDYYLNNQFDVITTINGIQIKKVDGIGIVFNVNDLSKKGYIEIDDTKIIPSRVEYVNQKIKEYVNKKYPGEDPKQFYVSDNGVRRYEI